MTPSAFVSQASADFAKSQPEISEFDIASTNLYGSETKSSYCLPSIPGLIYQFLLRKDGSLNFLFLTPTFGDFFELESWDIELDTDTLISMIHPEDVAGFHDSIAHSARNLQSWRWSGRFLLPSGEIKWIQWDAQPSLQANGNIFWNGLLVDVTTHHQLQAEVERLSFLLGLTERLQSSSELQEISEFALHYLVEATQATFGDIKVIRGVEENAQACPITDFMSAEFLALYGKPTAVDLNVDLPESIPKGEGVLWQVVETGQPLLIEDYANHPNALPPFRSLDVGEIGIFPIPAADGTVIGVLTLDSHNFQDIQNTSQADLLVAACRMLGVRIERVKAQERLRQTNTELELTSQKLREKAQELEQTLHELRHTQTQLIHNERMSSLGHLVAGIAHEINNPVNFIYGNVPHARQYFEDIFSLLDLYEECYSIPVPEIRAFRQEIDIDFLKEDLPKILSSMQVGTQRIRNIVRSLRNFSRLDEAERKAIDLHESIDNVLMILDSRLKQPRSAPPIQVIKDYGNLPLVDCYAGQLNQVFMYILMNAIDALEENSDRWKRRQSVKGGTPLIRISTEANFNDTVRIRIIDNGPGIPEAIQSYLFDPFFTTKPVGKGTGLGLSIAQQVIAEKHGGQLKCISTPGEGAEFMIEIPLQLAKAA